ncbi:MAG: hypothetical protein ACLPH3_24625, partial [Terracidiphilus sp.]
KAWAEGVDLGWARMAVADGAVLHPVERVEAELLSAACRADEAIARSADHRIQVSGNDLTARADTGYYNEP